MNDLISRQAAMDEMSKQQTYKMFVGEDTVYLDANDVGSVLASLPSAQQWTPCSERLPKEEKWYLITVHPEYVPEGCGQVDLLVWYRGEWQWLTNEGRWEKWPYPIIAWMPLPEPYEAERKEE